MMLETVRRVAELPVDAVKLHLLYIIKGTVMGQEYLEGKVRELSMEEYVGIVCDQLELLPPEVVIERITGDGRGGNTAGAALEPEKAPGDECH